MGAGHFVHRPDVLRENGSCGVPSPKIAITNDDGTLINQQRYMPFGQVRYLPGSPTITSTDFGYTGQRNLDSEIGLMDYKARFYSPLLGRFVQPDSLIPNASNPQAWNRFSYVNNHPINFNDPTGHDPAGHDPAGTSCYLRGYCDNPNDTWGAASRYSAPKPFKGFTFIFSCGQETDCPNKRIESIYNNQVPLQPLRDNVEFLGGTIIDLGDQDAITNKLTYAEDVKNAILASSDAQGVFLVGHSFGTGANTMGAYDLITELNSPLNLKGHVILDSYLLTGNGSGIDLGPNKDPKDYDTQYKADIVTDLVPLFVAHSPGRTNDTDDFPDQGMGSEYGTNHYTLANDSRVTNDIINFFLAQIK